MVQYADARPEYELWYVPEFPLGDFDLSYTDAPKWNWRNRTSIDLLVQDIQRQGLVNPLIARFRPEVGDIDRPIVAVGGCRVFVLVRKLGWTHAPCVVCGSGGRRYKGAKQLSWDDEELHALFKDGVLGVNTTSLCMAQCCDRKKGEVPASGFQGSYYERASGAVYVGTHLRHPAVGRDRRPPPSVEYDYSDMPADFKV